MFRILIGMLLFLGITVMAFSQEKKNQLPADFTITLDLSGKKTKKTGRLPFKNIIVKDYRFDTTKIGYYRTRTQIALNAPPSVAFTSSLNEYFHDLLDPASEKAMVIIVKTFWLQQEYDVTENNVGIKSGNFYFPSGNAVCVADFEVFSQTGNELRALLKLDYEFDLSSYRKSRLDEVSLIAFDSIAVKIQSMPVDEMLARKKVFTWEELDKAYTKRFDLPVLTTVSPPKGVFLTFDDFRQGKIGHSDFVFRKGSLTDELYVKSGNSETLLLEFWGFFDGKDYYIRLGHNFFRLLRQNNTFDFMGAKNLTRYSSNFDNYSGRGVNSNGRLTITQTKLDLKPLQIDMQTGEVY